MIETPLGDIKKKKKKPFKPPVPRFDEPGRVIGGDVKNDEEKNNEIFSKFLEEINGGPTVSVAEVSFKGNLCYFDIQLGKIKLNFIEKYGYFSIL